EGATIDDIIIEDYWAAGAQHSVDGLWVTVPGDAGDRVQDWKQQRQTTGDNQVTNRDCFTRETGIVRVRHNLREEVDDTQPECKIGDDSHTRSASPRGELANRCSVPMSSIPFWVTRRAAARPCPPISGSATTSNVQEPQLD